MNEVQVRKDVALVYWDTTSDISRIICDKLHRNGYTVELVPAKELERITGRVVVVMPVVAGDCAKGIEFGNVPVVPVWPNNCPCAVGLPVEFSTLDMIGTDFDMSLDKACGRFPEELAEKNSAIRHDIKYGHWDALLSKNPELADLCRFDQIGGDGWTRLLIEQPQFASKCDWDKLGGSDWEQLLRENPQFADKCDWTKLDGGHWVSLLAVRPEFGEHCDWKKIKECYHWVELLSKQPLDAFANRCDFSKIDGWRWVELLVEQPQFADRCDWRKLNGKNWAELLAHKPEFSGECDWGKIGSAPWAELLGEHPEFSDKCVWTKLNGEDWASLLCGRPEFFRFCDLRKLSGWNWCNVVSAHPEFATECDWKKFSGEQWSSLLCSQPQFEKQCQWKKLTPADWARLLEQRPEFADHCDWEKMQSLNATQWSGLLYAQPQFVGKCDASKVNWQRVPAMLEKHKELAQACDWKTLPFKTVRDILSVFPECVNRACLSRFSKDQLAELCSIGVNIPKGALIQSQADVYLCSEKTGRNAAQRLADALERRQYAVYVDQNDDFTEDDKAAIDAAKYVLLIRTSDLFEGLINRTSVVAKELEYALSTGKRIVSIGPSDEKWQDARSLPETFRSIETDQVKNLDLGDLFEEKVDTIVRESMKNERGSLAKKYDVFISYRRATGDKVARRIHQQLKEMGYLAFLDYDCILNGKYDKVIRTAIDSAPVFISVLTDHSLDRCTDSEDWVRTEIRMALENGKCVIPVSPDNQHWSMPRNLPPELDALRSLDVSALEMDGDFAGSMQKVVDRFPVAAREKANEILAAICDPGDTRTIGEAHDTPLTDVLKKWPDAISLFDYREFGRDEWKLIMCKVPELASKCDWSKLAHFDLVDIVRTRPELAELCDFSCFEGWNWECLLRDRPEFAKICEWHKFTGEDWNCLYRDNPKLAKEYEHLRDWSSLRGRDWVALLKKRPEFAEKCDWGKLDGSDLANLLAVRPELIEKCDLSVMDGNSWAELLSEKIGLAEWCKDWWMLDGECWALLLKEWPCEEIEIHCDWCKLNGANWLAILTSDNLHLYNDKSIPTKVRDDLRARFQRMAAECRKYAEGCDWSDVNGSDWAELLVHCPELSDQCDWSLLDQKDWNLLLRAHGEFTDQCIACGFKVPIDYGVPMIEHKHSRSMPYWEFEESLMGVELEYVGEDEDEFKNKHKFLKWEETENDDAEDFDTMAQVDFELAFDDGWSDGYAVVYGSLSIGSINDVVAIDDVGIRVDCGNHEVPDLGKYLADTLACLSCDEDN